jgi:hypothetical protein
MVANRSESNRIKPLVPGIGGLRRGCRKRDGRFREVLRHRERSRVNPSESNWIKPIRAIPGLSNEGHLAPKKLKGLKDAENSILARLCSFFTFSRLFLVIIWFLLERDGGGGVSSSSSPLRLPRYSSRNRGRLDPWDHGLPLAVNYGRECSKSHAKSVALRTISDLAGNRERTRAPPASRSVPGGAETRRGHASYCGFTGLRDRT